MQRAPVGRFRKGPSLPDGQALLQAESAGGREGWMDGWELCWRGHQASREGSCRASSSSSSRASSKQPSAEVLPVSGLWGAGRAREDAEGERIWGRQARRARQQLLRLLRALVTRDGQAQSNSAGGSGRAKSRAAEEALALGASVASESRAPLSHPASAKHCCLARPPLQQSRLGSRRREPQEQEPPSPPPLPLLDIQTPYTFQCMQNRSHLQGSFCTPCGPLCHPAGALLSAFQTFLPKRPPSIT